MLRVRNWNRNSVPRDINKGPSELLSWWMDWSGGSWGVSLMRWAQLEGPLHTAFSARWLQVVRLLTRQLRGPERGVPMGPLGAARLLMTYCQRSQKSVLSRLPKQVRKASRDSGEESPASLLNGKRTKNWLPPLIPYRQSGCFVYKPRSFLSKWGSRWTLLQKMAMRIK